MKLFKKAIKEAKELDTTITQVSAPKPEPKEEWIWVEGYKGTDKDMRCNNYQYGLGVLHTIPNDQKVQMCKNGFHLCLTLDDVFEYYPVGNGCRFFKVQALVCKSDKERYGTYKYTKDVYGSSIRYDKLVAKAIIFQSELTIDEILEDTEARDWPTQYKQIAIETNIGYAKENYHINTLIEDGYSQPFAYHIIKQELFDIAHAVGSLKDLSMDMKVLTILYNR